MSERAFGGRGILHLLGFSSHICVEDGHICVFPTPVQHVGINGSACDKLYILDNTYTHCAQYCIIDINIRPFTAI